MTACEHPEESLEPLPYDGTPASSREWECGDCGHWEIDPLLERERSVARMFAVPHAMMGVDLARDIRDSTIAIKAFSDGVKQISIATSASHEATQAMFDKIAAALR